MLRPERMSKVSVTGAKAIMPTVIETVHELNLVHLSDYDGSWEGFGNGSPIEGGEEASERLVTIRSLERTLGIDEATTEPEASIDPDTLDDRLETAREDITAVEDSIRNRREERRDVQERIEALEPFASLGIDLDLYRDYDTLDVAVGEGDAEEISSAIEAADEIEAFELFEGDDAIAVFAKPATNGEPSITDALVGVEFSTIAVPDVEGTPTDRIADLRRDRDAIDADLESLESDLDRLRDEHGGFLRAAERYLTTEVDRAEAPLRFATTERAFVAEGWIPTVEVERLEATLRDRVDDHVDVDELERAEYHGGSEHHHTQAVATDGGESAPPEASVTMDDEPPVVLHNPTAARPFELLTNLVNRPKYGEIDPTLAVFITFPLAFGFMIGDIGYGVLYILMGWFLLRYDSVAMQTLGSIAVWCGGFTVLFGWFFDDTFGVHLLDYDLALFHSMELLGLGFLSKGIQSPDWLMTWILASLIFGWLHLNIGLVIRFINELAHGWKAAIYEAGSWILAMNGFIVWLFSHQDAGPALGIGPDLTAATAKPAEFFGPESVIAHTGFHGFPELLGALGIVALLVGVVMVGVAEGVAGLAESPAWILGHFLSYLRIVAVLLGKGAMAFVVNLIVFGAYIAEDGPREGYVLFNLPNSEPEIAAGGYAVEVSFAGLWNMEPAILLIPLAIAVFIVGHIIVLLLGITAAGIQMLRLEYVEFFQKFFEGGGREFEAFGPNPDPFEGG